jgi:hypothetical protein
VNFNVFKPVTGIVLALSACFAHATVIDFNTSQASFASVYQDDGFDFKSNLLFGLTKTTLAEALDATLTVSLSHPAAGATFDLTSFQLSASNLLQKKGANETVIFSYTQLGKAAVTETLPLSNKAGLLTFTEDLSDLTSFTLKGGSILTSFQLDNLDVTAVPATPAVPEPASLALLLAGLGLVGTMARRRKA